jgi:site-specific DNA-methyltransferase (cytosine-N4-specific)
VGSDRHPARFPAKLPEFFIRFLTDPGDIVLDIFAGSNTTGSVAEIEGRRWLAFEERQDYLAASVFRFMPKDTPATKLQAAYDAVSTGEPIDLTIYMPQVEMFQTAAV